jgi:TonB family protein
MASMNLMRSGIAAAVMAVAAGYASVALPLAQLPAEVSRPSEPGPVERRANPITPENPIPRRLYSVAPRYPSEAVVSRAPGNVLLRITVDESGRVAEARRDGGGVNFPTIAPSGNGSETAAILAAFTTSAVDAVRQWIYDPPAKGPISFFVQFGFNPDSETRLLAHDVGRPASGGVRGGVPGGITGGARGGGRGGVPGGVSGGVSGAVPGAVRVGGNVTAPKKIKDVPPVYPAIAQSAGVQGVVILEVTIGADGRVADARVIRSIPLLDASALDAVRQWEFTPTLLNGVPTAIIMSATVNFVL